MIQKVKDFKNLDVTTPILESDGVFIVENFIQGDVLNNLKDEVMKKCSNSKNYEFGKLYRGKPLMSYGESNPISQVFNQKWMKDLNDVYYPGGGYGKSVIATHDYVSTQNWARQGWLHFDKVRSFKFFLYLSDIDISCGALHLSPKSREQGTKLSKFMTKKGLYESKRRLEESSLEYVKAFPPEPVEGPAGTLIVFDTDTFHKGGVVEEGKERLIVRLHNK
ncbi:phytanoyl-CoA dioxygenase family protein [bacterium]|nr:phytanoyl-CoA dioxygenase family protein [bacterium]